jgi:hypothetical protein
MVVREAAAAICVPGDWSIWDGVAFCARTFEKVPSRIANPKMSFRWRIGGRPYPSDQ